MNTNINAYNLCPAMSLPCTLEQGILRTENTVFLQDIGEGGAFLLDVGCTRPRLSWKEAQAEILLNGAPEGTQYFGQPVRDWCLLDLTTELAGKSALPEIRIKTRGISLASQAFLHYFPIRPFEGRILVIAPHPDDGELGCSSFYGPDTWVVNLTAGSRLIELDKQYYDSMDGTAEQACRRKGLLRAHDAVTAPMLGGVLPGHAVCLGYHDSGLEEILKGEEVRNQVPPAYYRRYNYPNAVNELGLLSEPRNIREDLEGELAGIIDALKPAVILVTDPCLDNHPDHRAAGQLLLEMKQRGATGDARILFYTLHARHERDFNFGPAGSRITLPRFKHPVKVPPELRFTYVMRPMNDEDMKRKAIMMDAMHDLYLAKDHRWKKNEELPWINSPRLGKAYYFMRFIKRSEIFTELLG